MSDEERLKWVQYLDEENSGAQHGSYSDRFQEYEQVYSTLYLDLGLSEHDMIVDVGAGTNDADRAFRSLADFSFKYLPVCGSTFGVDFLQPSTWELLDSLSFYSEYYIAIETVEHLWDVRYLFNHIEKFATKGAVITTPNAAVYDTIAADTTHFSALTETTFKRFGYQTRLIDFCGRSRVPGQGDAIIAWKDFR